MRMTQFFTRVRIYFSLESVGKLISYPWIIGLGVRDTNVQNISMWFFLLSNEFQHYEASKTEALDRVRDGNTKPRDREAFYIKSNYQMGKYSVLLRQGVVFSVYLVRFM